MSWFEASERQTDLIFATQKTLEAYLRLDQLRRSVRASIMSMPNDLQSRKELIALAEILKQTAVDVVCMEYRAEPDELGMKWFDFSTSAIGRRWLAGETAMKHALESFSNLQPGQGLRIHGR